MQRAAVLQRPVGFWSSLSRLGLCLFLLFSATGFRLFASARCRFRSLILRRVTGVKISKLLSALGRANGTSRSYHQTSRRLRRGRRCCSFLFLGRFAGYGGANHECDSDRSNERSVSQISDCHVIPPDFGQPIVGGDVAITRILRPVTNTNLNTCSCGRFSMPSFGEGADGIEHGAPACI